MTHNPYSLLKGLRGLRFTVLDLRTGKDRVYRTEAGAYRFARRMANLSGKASVILHQGKA